MRKNLLSACLMVAFFGALIGLTLWGYWLAIVAFIAHPIFLGVCLVAAFALTPRKK